MPKKKDTTELLALICKALSEAYPNDPCKPGIQVSHLSNESLWYVAVHRYSLPFGEGRIVFAKEKGTYLDAALTAIAGKLVPPDSARKALAQYIGAKL